MASEKEGKMACSEVVRQKVATGSKEVVEAC
jgi:hypothetical protein